MTIDKLLQEITKLNQIDKLPTYIEVSDVLNDVFGSRIMINNEWQNRVYSWGICKKDKKYIYFETDDERGYILNLKYFDTEEEAVKYAYNVLILKNNAFDAEEKRKEKINEKRRIYN